MINHSEYICWNTGRHYTLAGQRIIATQLDDGTVLYIDYDRGLDGSFHSETRLNKVEIKAEVMYMYDNNKDKHFPRYTEEMFELYEDMMNYIKIQ